MKKVVMVTIVFVLSVILAGCLDYKAYELPQDKQSTEEQDLLNEIAAIENELGIAEENADDELKETSEKEESSGEEIILPELSEEPKEEKDLSVINIDENELVSLNVKTNDPDGDKVTYSFSQPLDSNGRWQTSYGDEGEYLVTITATDGKLTTEKVVKIVINRINVPPVIEGVKDITVKEGATVAFKPRVSDPNGDEVAIEISEPLSSGTFETDHTSAGEYQIIIVASDGELEVEASFRLMVEDVNVLPEISGLSDLTIEEGQMVEIKPVISDLDQDEISLKISEPVGNDGFWQTGYTDHGTYNVQVTVSDGKDTITKTVVIVVEDVNMPPEIVDVSMNRK